MNHDLLRYLRCVDCGGELTVRIDSETGGRIESGELRCAACELQWPIVRFVPRFVPATNYASNFGIQWNKFRRTQLDSHSGTTISRDRFFETTGWTEDELRGHIVLDVGCGAGRFAEIALSTGARVIAVDYSSAVDAAFENLKAHPGVDVVQADVYRLPFPPRSFDYVYCLGVLQHTPNPRAAFLALSKAVASGGKISIDVYVRFRLMALWPKYWLRPVTRRMDPAKLLAVLERVVPPLLRVSDALARVPRIGRMLRYAVPVMNHRPSLPQLSEAQLREWGVLDTLDMLTPAYDSPQTEETVAEWFRAAGIHKVDIFRSGFVIGRGER